MNRFYISLIAISCILSASSVQAQGVPVSGNGLELSASTNNPAPGQVVTITARSYSADIDSASITWTVNGKETQKGIGATTLQVTAPALGKKLDINVSATAAGGRFLVNSITITSGYVDMIMENNGYVHPFFKGKVPLSYQNTVTVTAIPHIANSNGVEYDPKTLVYSWRKNSQVIENQSGYGKQSIKLTGDIVPRGYTLTVTVTTRDGTIQTAGYLSVSFTSPTISFYLNDPLYGIFFNQAINGNVQIGSQKETGVVAVPFGFNKPASSLGDLSFAWLINGIEYPELSMKESIILRSPGDSAGTSNISLNIKNNKQFLQTGTGGFVVSFSASTPEDTALESITF